MSEKLFRFLLSELVTVRVRCQECQAVVEVPMQELATPYSNGRCPTCKKESFSTFYHHANQLSQAVANLKLIEKQAVIEFVLPIND